MIQRIQSVYLIFAVLLGVLSFYLSLDKPLVTIINLGFDPSFGFLAATVSSLVAFLCFKKRLLQARLCFLNIFILIFQLVLFAPSMNISEGFGLNGLVSMLSLLGILLLGLARRSIKKDEALVRSVDRIR